MASLRMKQQLQARATTRSRARVALVRCASEVQTTSVALSVVESGGFTVQGTVRKVNEDRFDVQVWFGELYGGPAPRIGPLLDRVTRGGTPVARSPTRWRSWPGNSRHALFYLPIS